MKIYAFIFCRSGSKSIKNKNIKNFNGISLLKRNIIKLKKVSKINKIFLSTDSEIYKNIAEEMGIIVPFLRPEKLSNDESNEIDAWKHIINFLKLNNDHFDIFMSVPVVSPLKKSKLIESCLDKFLSSNYDYLTTVVKSNCNPYWNLFKENNGNLEIFDKSKFSLNNRQSFEDLYQETTIAFISRPNIILNMTNNAYDSNLKIGYYEVKPDEGIDIDTEMDFEVAEFIHKKNICKNMNFSIFNEIFLKNKTAIITGGLGNVGVKIIETLIELNCSNIIIIDFDNENNKKKLDLLEEMFDYKLDFYNVDLSKSDEIKLFANKISKKYNIIDIIINCAALVGTSDFKGWCATFENQTLDAFDKCMDVNTKAPILLFKLFLNNLKLSDSPKVINISSIYGIIGNDFKLYEDTEMKAPLAYNISKAGLNMMSKYLASYYGEINLCINNIILGGVYRNQDEKFVRKYIDKVPLKRMAIEDDIKGIILYLSSNLSKYVTGQNFIIDGGLTCCI